MYLGIDPGRQKFGWALAEENGVFCASGIVPADSLEGFVQALVESPEQLAQWRIEGEIPLGFRIRKVFCGDGTGHAAYLETLLAWQLDVELTRETNTTLEARDMYWKMHRPRGLRRLLPVSLLVPPRCIDDLAAYCILRRAVNG